LSWSSPIRQSADSTVNNGAGNWMSWPGFAPRSEPQPRRREDDAIHLFTTERAFDAIAQGEIEALGLDREIVIESMVEKVLLVLR
jgi:hypothetical protein